MQNNPLYKLKMPKVSREKEIQYWHTTEEMQKVIDKSSGAWKTINIIGFCIGARLAEILSLTWESFDFQKDEYKIQAIGDFRTKSRKYRIGKLPPILKTYLITLKEEYAKNKHIKTNKNGNYVIDF